MNAVVLAAGRGTRMGRLTESTPKPLLTLCGRPIIEHILLGMRDAGIRRAIIVTGYLGEQIESHLGDGARLGMTISYRRQQKAQGTAKALLLARDLLGDDPFMLSWGDIIIERGEYAALAERFAATPCDAMLTLNPTDDPWRGAAVTVDDDWRVESLIEKPPRGTTNTRWNNAGIFIFTSMIFAYAERLRASERGEFELPQAISAMVADGRSVRAHPLKGFWSDLGTPEDLAAADAALEGRAIVADRVDALIHRYQQRFGAQPAFVVRAPGRVNLLGEHTDYNNLPVLPMAIERCVLIAGAARNDRRVQLDNVGSFPARNYELERIIPPFESGDWANYAKAAAQGLAEYYDAALPRGADLLVDGDIPAGAGLSSSSALVVASALAFLAANEREIPFETLAEILPPAERYVGTLSGGMDQTVSLLAEAGHALRIDFAPLRYCPVPLPQAHSIVVCHSLVRAEKSGAAKRAYNLRVIECRLACRVLEDALGEQLRQPLSALGDLGRRFPERPLSSFVDEVAGLVSETPLTLEEIAQAIGTDVDHLRAACGIPVDEPGPYAILRRARHVLTEAERVDRAEEALRAGDAGAFGELMDASHRSCRDDYEISCTELEKLVSVAKQAGAVGARLTGAGFGGCTVNLVADDRVERFLQEVDTEFYAAQGTGTPTTVRFVFRPQAGASTRILTPTR